MNPVAIPDVIAVGRYECPDGGCVITLEHARRTADHRKAPFAVLVCPCRRVELLAAVTVDASFVDEPSAARDTASTPRSRAAKREEWLRRARSFAAWLAVGFAIGAVFCGAWAIAEWGWAR